MRIKNNAINPVPKSIVAMINSLCCRKINSIEAKPVIKTIKICLFFLFLQQLWLQFNSPKQKESDN